MFITLPFPLAGKSWRDRLIAGSVILGFVGLLICGYQIFLMVQKVRDAANRSSDL